jgi:hypothetical protein
VADGPPADVGLGHLGHLDGGHDPSGLVEALEGVLEGKAVDDRSQHPHVVGLGRVHAGAGAAQPPPDVAAADHHGDVDVEAVADIDDLGRDAADDVAVDGVAAGVGERLARQLEDDATPAGLALALAVVGHGA